MKILLFLSVLIVPIFGFFYLNTVKEKITHLETNDVAEESVASFSSGEKNTLYLPQKTKEVLTENKDLYQVVKVIDGDTIEILMEGIVERIRIIGINTPETLDPRKPVECFGKEASLRARELLVGSFVKIEKDSSQGERDKYGRLLGYVFFSDGKDYGLDMISNGYAHEYTYIKPHKYQQEYKKAQEEAKEALLGLWGVACRENSQKSKPADIKNINTLQMFEDGLCSIKGNINTKKEKIYHLPGCASYKDTVIDESAGERWFCSEDEALSAGWRKAGNCL